MSGKPVNGVGGVAFNINVTGNRKYEALNILKLSLVSYKNAFAVNVWSMVLQLYSPIVAKSGLVA